MEIVRGPVALRAGPRYVLDMETNNTPAQMVFACLTKSQRAKVNAVYTAHSYRSCKDHLEITSYQGKGSTVWAEWHIFQDKYVELEGRQVPVFKVIRFWITPRGQLHVRD